MEDPDGGQNDAAHRHMFHHDKPDAHRQCHDEHDAKLCPAAHPPSLDIGLQVVFIQLCSDEPGVEPFRALGKGECG